MKQGTRDNIQMIKRKEGDRQFHTKPCSSIPNDSTLYALGKYKMSQKIVIVFIGVTLIPNRIIRVMALKSLLWHKHEIQNLVVVLGCLL